MMVSKPMLCSRFTPAASCGAMFSYVNTMRCTGLGKLTVTRLVPMALLDAMPVRAFTLKAGLEPAVAALPLPTKRWMLLSMPGPEKLPGARSMAVPPVAVAKASIVSRSVKLPLTRSWSMSLNDMLRLLSGRLKVNTTETRSAVALPSATARCHTRNLPGPSTVLAPTRKLSALGALPRFV